MTDARIVLTTLDDRERADRLARQLVELRLAACVNLIGEVRSIYRWRGQVESAAEVLLIIKTTAERFSRLKEKIIELHSYELPEIIVFNVADGSAEYLEWVLGACGGDAV